MNPLARALAGRIAAEGPIGFDDFMANALYAPGGGFYSAGGGAGRRRDFLTSPEVGPLFGAVMARALDAWWVELGRPDPYVVVDAGAGPGTLARSIRAAEPACVGALRLVLVERSDRQRAGYPPEVEARAGLPAPGDLGDGPVMVLANELLDNLPCALVELGADGWAEVRAGEELGGFVEVRGPLGPAQVRWCEARAGLDAPTWARLPVQADAAAWLGDALALAAGGRVVAIDYASDSGAMARRPWRDWVRTYAAHGRGGEPLDDPGAQDITVEVAVDQLCLVAPPDLDRDQATFLRAHGLDELVAEGADTWAQRTRPADLGAIAGRSRVHEADALTDPAGLGAFRVLEWVG